MTPPGPARLHVLLARDAPVGLVIRRGPAKQVCTLLWNRTSDTFELGQWLKGRIKEHWSDISPDGKHWVYFAMNGKWRSESGGTWRAIARVPYLKAIEFFPESGTWGGGSYFTSDGEYWVRGRSRYMRSTPVDIDGTSFVAEDSDWIEVEGDGSDIKRPLERDGWRLITPWENWRPGSDIIYERPIAAGWQLRKSRRRDLHPPRDRGSEWYEHSLCHSATGAELPFLTWQWADVDGERLVWAEGGKLFAARVSEQGLEDERLLHDFNAMTFEAIPAPY